VRAAAGDRGIVSFCAANVINHDLKTRLEALQQQGFAIRIESCLNNCGSCRHAAHCEFDNESMLLDVFMEKSMMRS